MKKYLSALAISVATITVVAPVAHADSHRCVSKAEYRHVHRGMAMSRVHRIFDTRGRLDFRTGRISVRVYRPCPPHSAVSVTYRRGHLSAKAAVWHHG